jgi:hypothetical protein
MFETMKRIKQRTMPPEETERRLIQIRHLGHFDDRLGDSRIGAPTTIVAARGLKGTRLTTIDTIAATKRLFWQLFATIVTYWTFCHCFPPDDARLGR